MPATDKYNEVLITSLAGIIIFLVITGMVVFILLFYQRKKFRHYQQIVDMKKRFSEELLKSQLEIQEETFNRISQEIHDNVGQVMSLAKVQINIMTESKRMDTEMLAEVKWNITKALTDLRDLARGLSSDRIRQLPLHLVTLEEADRINKTGVMQVTVDTEGPQQIMNAEKKLILFRVIQEAVQNIIKHAQASETLISFRYDPDEMEATIRDNGIGFNIGVASELNTGLGLSNMRTRVMLAGGRWRIDSSPGAGTTVTINMPYE